MTSKQLFTYIILITAFILLHYITNVAIQNIKVMDYEETHNIIQICESSLRNVSDLSYGEFMSSNSKIRDCDQIHIYGNQSFENIKVIIMKRVNLDTTPHCLVLLNNCAHLFTTTWNFKKVIVSIHRYNFTSGCNHCFISYKKISTDKKFDFQKFSYNCTKLTIVIVGFSPRRRTFLTHSLTEYGKLNQLLDKIILIWNNNNSSLPTIPISKVNITILKPDINSLNARFSIFSLVKTDAVLVIDDDVRINEILITKMFNTWKTYPDRLVGLDQRDTSIYGEYKYNLSSKPSLVITGTMILHVHFLKMYMSDKEIVKYVYDNRNGEDIAMNAVAQNYTCKGPVFIPKSFMKHRQSIYFRDGLSNSMSHNKWLQARTNAVTWLQKHFHYDVFHCKPNTTYVCISSDI